MLRRLVKMKNINAQFWLYVYIAFLFLASSMALISCNNSKDYWVVPDELIGTWKSEKTRVNVRTQLGFLKYKFTPGMSSVSITVNKQKTVSGSIGMYEFNNGILTMNGSYKVVCDSVGKIFKDDPFPGKEVSIWLYPPFTNGLKAELRYTEDGAKYPMARLAFSKIE
jgi:hypothetical protein